ncbi:hypothetical protein Agabi119p4_5406 [Agaricus bisporus var. burnettii]|uniref:RRM domain-containing protein n=1 Tax=Agaricus bisporus var. burnettii TaxID=192524 RepID=A0A8H7F1M5_AGABI|nr:hypothetical protein Agabi119p4_5406 [Agaricus bisporus var. burnettii]
MDPSNSTVSKRLHISGLTPSISQQDLSQRLSTFGTLKSLDGLGLVDAVGNPRKFAYATLEGAPAKVTKCMNVLSGSTWKGTKLRIGEAKPDFRERIQVENEKAASAPPPKKKNHWRFSPYSAVHSKNMDMPQPSEAPEPAGPKLIPTKPTKLKPASSKTKVIFTDEDPTSTTAKATATVSVISVSQPEERPQQQPRPQARDDLDLHLEAKQSLNLLDSLFGGSSTSNPSDSRHENQAGHPGVDNWIGRETLDSDVDEADFVQQAISNQFGDGDMDFEIVPRDDRPSPVEHASDPMGMEVDKEEQVQDPKPDSEEQPHQPVVNPPSEKALPIQTSNKLKDLFAPREPEGGFSLLGHLNLDDDLELDDDVPFPTTHEETDPQVALNDQHIPRILPTATISSSNTTQKQTRFTSQITLDSSKPLFFPIALLSSHPSASSSFLSNTKNRPKDLFEELEAKGRDWRSLKFYRTQSEDEIRQRWEEQKGELTQGWKKRWREAGKFRRRRGTGAGEDG